MTDFYETALISHEHLSHLQQLVRGTLHSLVLHPSNVEIRGSHHVLSPSVSLRSGSGGYVIVENRWGDSPGGQHYGQLRIRCGRRPPGIERGEVDNRANTLTMKPFQGLPPIKQIEIFERVIASEGQSGPAYNSELVRYDAAIVFRRQDHSAFRLGPEDGPLGRVEFCQLWSDIRRISSTLDRRVVITEEEIDIDPPPA